MKGRIISFSWTTPALLAGAKTVTRRNWKDKWARTFKGGEVLQAYNRSPRNGGEKVAIIRLTMPPYQENTLLAPDADFILEGFHFLKSREKHRIDGITPDEIWKRWKTPPGQLLWVVRFNVIEVVS